MEELEGAGAGGEHERVLLVKLRRLVRRAAGLFELGQRVIAPQHHVRVVELDAAGRSVEAGAAIKAQQTLLVLPVLEIGIGPDLLLALFEGFVRKLVVSLVLQDVVNPLDAVFPGEVLGMQALADHQRQLVITHALLMLRDLYHRAMRHPPATLGIALGAHGGGQDQIGERDRRRGHEQVVHDNEVNAAQGTIQARSIGAHVRDGVRGGHPHHANGIRISRLDRLQDGVGVCRGAITRTAHERELGAEALGLDLGGEVTIAIPVGQVLLVGVADDDVAAGHIDVARDGPKRIDSVGRRGGVRGLVDLEAPLDSGRLGVCVQTSSLDDLLGLDPANLAGLLGRPLLAALDELVEAIAPLLDEVVIVEVLLRDDMNHCHRQSGISAGAHAQPDLGAGSQPGERRVDGNHLCTTLHAVDDPVAEEVIGVGNDGIAAPVHDDLGAAPLGVLLVIALLELLRHVGNKEVTVHGRHGGRTRTEAGVTGKVAHREIGRAKCRIGHVRDVVVVVTAGTDVSDDGLGTIVLPDGTNLFLDDIESLVPADLLPLVLTALSHALHRMTEACGIVDVFRHLEAAHAQRALVKGVVGIAFDLYQLSVLVGVIQDATTIVATGTRPGRGARDGVIAVLPLPLAFVALVVVFRHRHSSLASCELTSLDVVECVSSRRVLPATRRCSIA